MTNPADLIGPDLWDAASAAMGVHPQSLVDQSMWDWLSQTRIVHMRKNPKWCGWRPGQFEASTGKHSVHGPTTTHALARLVVIVHRAGDR